MENCQKAIRWQQRFVNYRKAMARLRAAVSQKSYSDLEEQGLIQSFEYTVELAWKVMQDLLEAKGNLVKGPKPVMQQAFQDGYLTDGDAWADMLESRNLTVHSYDEAVAAEVSRKIKLEYYALLAHLEERLNEETNEP